MAKSINLERSIKTSTGGYAIQLYFGGALKKTTEAMWRTLKDEGISSYLIETAATPHLSLSVTHNISIEACGPKGAFEELVTEHPPPTITTAGIGIFPGERPVLYRTVVKDKALMQVQERWHELGLLCQSDFWKQYLPENWVPHITLAMVDLDPKGIGRAVEICHDLDSVEQAAAERIALVRFPNTDELISCLWTAS